MKLTPLILLLLAIGCSGVQTRTYDLTVHNLSSRPLTIWLTKTGDVVYENAWLAPEQIAIMSPSEDRAVGGVYVPPGQTASTGPLKGKFAPEDEAILRIYQDQLSLEQILAVSRGNSARMDVLLDRGTNELNVTDRGGGLKIERIQPMSPTTGSSNGVR